MKKFLINNNINNILFISILFLSCEVFYPYEDECGVIDGDNTSCLDECGVVNGDNTTCSRCRVKEKNEHHYTESIITITEYCYDNISEEQCHEYYQPFNCFPNANGFGTECINIEIFYEQGSCENYDGN